MRHLPKGFCNLVVSKEKNNIKWITWDMNIEDIQNAGGSFLWISHINIVKIWILTYLYLEVLTLESWYFPCLPSLSLFSFTFNVLDAYYMGHSWSHFMFQLKPLEHWFLKNGV